jgi:hypothetical protein
MSGGSILAVMRLLNHKHPETTRDAAKYAFEAQHSRLYGTFSNAEERTDDFFMRLLTQ